MIIQLTEDEAITIADFLVNSIEAIKTRPKTPEVSAFLDAAHEFIVQTWMKTNEHDKQMIIEEHQKKFKDEN